jgi:transposase-like protein
VLAQAVIELEASERVGADKHERTPGRSTYRNGYRGRAWDTRVGRVNLKIPKLREGSFFPELLQPRRWSEQALLSVVQEAYVHGVSARKMDELVKALGLEGISKSEVSGICQLLDEAVGRFLGRPIELPVPYMWLDATYLKVREDGRVVSMALVVAIGVGSDGEREVLGLDVGPSEEAAFWQAFLRDLVERGLSGVKLVISDAHVGLKQAIGETFAGAAWQRCRVHFMRNLLAHVPKAAQPMVAALVRTIFAQPDQAAAGTAPTPPPLHEPAREAAQGDQASLQRGRHLPQPARGGPAGGGSSHGAERRVAVGRALLQHRVHGGHRSGEHSGAAHAA